MVFIECHGICIVPWYLDAKVKNMFDNEDDFDVPVFIGRWIDQLTPVSTHYVLAVAPFVYLKNGSSFVRRAL